MVKIANNKLTVKQKEVLEAIEYFIEKNKYSPTYREIGKMLSCDQSTAFNKVMKLEEKGYIKSTPGLSRSICVMKKEL